MGVEGWRIVQLQNWTDPRRPGGRQSAETGVRGAGTPLERYWQVVGGGTAFSRWGLSCPGQSNLPQRLGVSLGSCPSAGLDSQAKAVLLVSSLLSMPF